MPRDLSAVAPGALPRTVTSRALGALLLCACVSAAAPGVLAQNGGTPAPAPAPAPAPGQAVPPQEDPATAPSTDEALEKLKQSLQAEPNLSPATKAAMADFFDALAAKQAQLDTVDLAALQRLAVSGAVTTPGRWEKLKEQLTLAGDIRLREEFNFNLDDQDTRDRARLRLRLGGDYRLDDEWAMGARLRTGDPTDPNSPHTTLGDTFDSDNFELDRAFIAYKPAALQGLRFVGGKFAHPFYANPVYGELVWDADVNPEGIAATYTVAGSGKGSKLDFALGRYESVEQGGGDEARMTVAQVAGTTALGEKTSGTLALGYYAYGKLTPDGSVSLVNENPSQTSGGNALVDADGDGTADGFLSRFDIWNPIASVTYEGFSLPVVFSGEYIKNTSAETTRDGGEALGVAVGRQKQAGDWLWYGQWQRVEQDAVFAAFAQDDFLQTANFEGWVFGTRYRITDNVGAHLWGLVSAREKEGGTATTDSNGDQWRVRLDLDVRF
jgi:hypothetical protein